MTRNNSETKSEQITELFDLFDQNLTDDELTIKLRSKIEELRGFNINEQKEGEEENPTLLYLAVRKKYPKCAKMLLAKGADSTIAKFSFDHLRNLLITIPYESWQARNSDNEEYQELGDLLKKDASDRLASYKRNKVSESFMTSERRPPVYFLNPDKFFPIDEDGGAKNLAYRKGSKEERGSYAYIKNLAQNLKIPKHVISFNDNNCEISCYAEISQISSSKILKDVFFELGYGWVGNSFLHSKSFFDQEDTHEILLRRFESKRILKTVPLRQKAKDFFYSNSQVYENRTEIENFSQLLQDSFCIGEAHRDIAPKRFLIENMKLLKERGYETLFMEHLFYDSAMQDSLDDYFQGSEMTADLEDYLKRLNTGFDGPIEEHLSVSDYNFLTLVRSAKENGIKVVGIDTNESYLMGKTEYGSHGEERMRGMNFVAQEVIKKESNSKKWVALMGNLHLGSCNNIPGVAQLLNVPSVDIYTKKDLAENNYKFNQKSRTVLNHNILSNVIIECAENKSLIIDAGLNIQTVSKEHFKLNYNLETKQKIEPEQDVEAFLISPDLKPSSTNIWSRVSQINGKEIYISNNRQNKYRILTGIYNKENSSELNEDKIKDTFKQIIANCAKEDSLSNEDIFKIIQHAKEKGGINNNLSISTEKYETGNLEGLDEDFRKTAKKFSATFQKQCNALGIYTGRAGENILSVGLRLTFLPDKIFEELKEYRSEIRSAEFMEDNDFGKIKTAVETSNPKSR